MSLARVLASFAAHPAAATPVNVIPTGAVFLFDATSAPAGFIELNGGTIGNASSGASTRANADTYALFVHYWTNYTNAERPILTSAGGASTRGASADADWAANKRITISEGRGEFFRGLDRSRGVDASRKLGIPQAEMVGPHTHPGNGRTDRNTSAGGTDQVLQKNATANALDPAVNSNSGTENRPRNVAFLA